MINETTEGQEAGEQREELFFKVIKAGNKILEILAALFIILMLLYGAYSLWDTCQINRRAFISGELMKYKPAGKMDESPSLQELQKINPDVCAWLTVDGTKIDYPVVQGETNLEYINQDIYGEFALSGSIFCQEQRVFEISSGTGAIVIGLASVIIGTSLFKNISFMKATTAVLIGSVIYKACVAAALKFFEPQDMKLITAVLFLLILVIGGERRKKVKKNARA